MIKRTKNTSIAETPQMLCIKTDKGCFISDCLSRSGYDYNCHRTDIVDLIFKNQVIKEDNNTTQSDESNSGEGS